MRLLASFLLLAAVRAQFPEYIEYDEYIDYYMDEDYETIPDEILELSGLERGKKYKIPNKKLPPGWTNIPRQKYLKGCTTCSSEY